MTHLSWAVIRLLLFPISSFLSLILFWLRCIYRYVLGARDSTGLASFFHLALESVTDSARRIVRADVLSLGFDETGSFWKSSESFDILVECSSDWASLVVRGLVSCYQWILPGGMVALFRYVIDPGAKFTLVT